MGTLSKHIFKLENNLKVKSGRRRKILGWGWFLFSSKVLFQNEIRDEKESVNFKGKARVEKQFFVEQGVNLSWKQFSNNPLISQ